MEILMGILVFVLGVCFGSFVNMLVYRTAEKYKLINNEKLIINNKNRSFCDFCGKQLNWYENVPIFSWLFLKSKTKCCHKKLPLSYPVVELITGILFLIFNFKFEIFNQIQIFNFQFLIVLLMLVFLVFSAVFDLKYMILPDFSTVILIGLALVLMWGRHRGLPIQYLLSVLVASGFLLALNLITKGKGMGMGDVKFAVFMGLFLGFPKIIVAFYVAFIVGAVVGVILMVFKKVKKKSQVPFGPFLILGFLTAWLYGDLILKFVNIKLGL